MTQIRLSDAWLRASQNPGTISDVLVPALKVRIGKSGVKTFTAVCWRDGRPARATFGRYPTVTLAEARRRADAFERGESRSEDPGAAHPAGNGSDVGADLPVTVLFEDYVARMRRRGQPAADTYEATFYKSDLSFVSFLKRRHGRVPAAHAITPDDAAAWLRERQHTAAFHAHYLRSHLHAAFQWGLRQRHDFTGEGRDYGLVHNPIAALPTGLKASPRDRVLSIEELRTLWAAFVPANTAHRALKLIVTMGGLRVTEVSESRLDWWTDGMLRLPKTKNGRAHEVPVPAIAQTVLDLSRQLAAPGSPFLFANAHTPNEPITRNGVIRSTKGLNARLKLEPWTPRDLRRTMKTHLIERGVDERWLDVWHNHGQNADVARRHYIRAEYLEVKRKVAAAIDDFIDGQIMPTASERVSKRTRRAR
jgi:integrase